MQVKNSTKQFLNSYLKYKHNEFQKLTVNISNVNSIIC